MKNLSFILTVFIVTSLPSLSQIIEVPFKDVLKIADQNAAALWGYVSSSEPIAYYSKNDELIGYRFNYAIGKPFPAKEKLMQQCEDERIRGNSHKLWGLDEYGTMFVSARKDIGVIQDYSKSLSPEYAFGFKMEALAAQTLVSKVWLKKVYYVNFVNQWFCYTNGSKEVYINVFPKTHVVDREKFLEITQSMPYFCAKGDYSEEWNAYQTGIPMAGKAQVWIPHPEMCKFIDWSYGCGPCAASMLVSWWDFNSMNTADNYATLIDYHFQRWDGIQEETDYQVPNVLRELAIAMETDTIYEGGTNKLNICPGYEVVFNDINGYDFTCTHHNYGLDSVWYFEKIVSEIGTFQRPIHISIPGHYECCVAYDDVTDMIGVHNTWWGAVQWIHKDQLERVYTVEPGGGYGLAIGITCPKGDIHYNQTGSGEVFYAGLEYEIRWDHENLEDSYAVIWLSTDGGYNWTAITANTPNDGKFEWIVPIDITSITCRIIVGLYSSEDVYLGGDGSLGNFEIWIPASLHQLQDEAAENTTNDPCYYQLWHNYSTWCAIGVRASEETEWWGIEMYDDETFTDELASSSSLNRVEFVVMDGHHSTLHKGIKVDQWIGSSEAIVEFEGENETLLMGNNSFSWTGEDVVEMFDLHLTPDTYAFLLLNWDGVPNLDFALFESNNSAYYAGRQDFLAGSTDLGFGDKVITIEIDTEDDYGLCVWANDTDGGNYSIRIENRETWTGQWSSDWRTASNWSLNYEPDEFTDVIIPAGTPHAPIIDYNGVAACSKNLEIEAGATLTCLTDLEVYGNLNSDGLFTMTGSNSDLTFHGGNDAYISDPNADDIYTTVFIQKATPDDKVVLLQDMNISEKIYVSEGIFKIEGALTLNIGSAEPDAFGVYSGGSMTFSNNPEVNVSGGVVFKDGSAATIVSGTIRCGGDFLVENNVTNDIVFAGGTLTMNGNSDQHILNQDDGNLVLHNLTIDNPGNCHIEDGDLTVNGDLLVDEGNLELNGYGVMCAGNVTIMDGGKISVDENAVLRIGQNHVLSVNNGGILKVLGEPGDRAMISVMPEGTGYYSLNINSGGIISARRAIFERMDANGVYLHNGAIVDPAFTFDQCIFRDGISGSAALFVILNDQDFTVTEAVFPDNTWGGQYNVWKSNNSGQVTFAGATGDFSGPEYEYDPNNLIEWFPVFWSLDVGIMLEGPFNGSEMEAGINSELPEYQPFEPVLPYFANPMPEWFYTGDEFVLEVPNTEIVDWVIVELRDAPIVQQALPGTAIEKRAAFVNKSGHIVALDGISQLSITNTFSNNLFAVVWHRNHIGIISAYPLVETKGTLSYDFTTGPNKAYGGMEAMKELAPGIWGMVSGDSDGNGMIEDADKTNAWDMQAGNALYSGCDLNMDNQVDNSDKNDMWILNLGFASHIPGSLFHNCGDPLTDTRDGQTYTTVQIGTQCWMAKNLNLGSMIAGEESQMNNGDFEKYCYNNTAANCGTYGGLYQWDEMMQYITQEGTQGICPDDWHIPSDPEWTTLITFLGGAETAGGKLKETGTVHWAPPNTGATNESGFTGLPGGYNYGGFIELTHNGYSWSSTELSSNAYYMRLIYSNSYAYQQATGKVVGLSVRCLKDNNLPPAVPSNPTPPNGATNQPVNTALSWSCSDPENDPLTYDVYFGNITPLELVSTGQSSNSFNPGTLNYNTAYYWKIVALDGQGNSTEGTVWSFTTESEPVWTCGDPIVDSRDMQTYNTVQIGTQCWMAENLNIGTMVPGTNEMTNDGVIEKYCYEDIATNCSTYGGLYQWTEMMQYSTAQGVQGICMVGWHLPTDAEWTILTDFLGGESVAGGKMKETGTTHWKSPNVATNESGFTALPGGFRSEYGQFYYLSDYAYFWSSTENSYYAWARDLYYYYANVYRYIQSKTIGYSVRCLKD